MASPRRTHTSTALVAVLGIFGCDKKAAPAPEPPAPVAAPVAIDAAPVAVATDAATSSGKITISVIEPKPAGSGFAKRCAIGGTPLATDCIGGSKGVAFDAKGRLYVANAGLVHRYTVGDDCTLEPVDQIELPPNNPRPQTVGKGPIYMRSGGVAWEPVRAGDAVYVHDFLVGLYRIDRGKPEPACTTEFGFREIAFANKKFYGKRRDVEVITPGAKCTAKPAKDTPPHALRKLDLPDLCAATAATPCGDGTCILDHNCPQLFQLGPDDALVRTISSDKLFDVRPWSLDGAATAPDGRVALYARFRDRIDGKDTCEAAVYMIPAAVFAR